MRQRCSTDTTALLHPSVARQIPPLVLSVSRGGRWGAGGGGGGWGRGEVMLEGSHSFVRGGRLSIILYYRSFVTVSFEAANFLPARLGTTTFLLHNRLLASGAALLTPATTAEDSWLNQNAGTLCIHVPRPEGPSSLVHCPVSWRGQTV